MLFKDLQVEFVRAKFAWDTAALKLLDEELELRQKNPNVAKLKDDIRNAIEEINLSRTGISTTKSDPRWVETPKTKGNAPPNPSSKIYSKSKFSPTSEQEDAVQSFMSGSSLKLNAYAGTGKTSTLQLLANATPKTGQYIAFNRDIVSDARTKFPQSVNCSTSHSLAMKAAPSGYKSDMAKLTGKVNANQLAQMLGLKREKFDQHHILQPRSQAYLMLETVKKFAQSADPSIEPGHVPQYGALLSASEAVASDMRNFALQGARFVWSRMLDERDPLPLGHDGYLKLWGLSQPRIAADFILLDEAQDTNPVVLDILRRQSAQLVYVGDKYQQIYEWRGAVNAMEEIQTDRTSYLTTSFRFGEEIAELASSVLALLQEPRPVRGNPSTRSRIGAVDRPDAILARTNASTISAVIVALDEGRKPHLAGGTKELMDMLRGVQALRAGEPSDVPDFFGFTNWNEVIEFSKTSEGTHLLTFVNLVETRGEKQLMWALNRTVSAEDSSVVISTGHKAKGREWKSVRLMDDFLRSKPGNKASFQTQFDAAELRLLYVAITRAKEMLDVPSTIVDLLAGREHLTSGEMPTRPSPAVQSAVVVDAGQAPQFPHSVKHFTPPPRSTMTPETTVVTTTVKPARPKRTGIMKWLLGE